MKGCLIANRMKQMVSEAVKRERLLSSRMLEEKNILEIESKRRE